MGHQVVLGVPTDVKYQSHNVWRFVVGHEGLSITCPTAQGRHFDLVLSRYACENLKKIVLFQWVMKESDLRPRSYQERALPLSQ